MIPITLQEVGADPTESLGTIKFLAVPRVKDLITIHSSHINRKASTYDLSAFDDDWISWLIVSCQHSINEKGHAIIVAHVEMADEDDYYSTL